MPPPPARLRCQNSSSSSNRKRAGSCLAVKRSHLLVLLLAPLLLAVATAQRPSSGDGSRKGFLASVADAVGGAIFGGNSMGQAAGKPFGERAAAVVTKPLGCPTGWEREEKQETGGFNLGFARTCEVG